MTSEQLKLAIEQNRTAFERAVFFFSCGETFSEDFDRRLNDLKHHFQSASMSADYDPVGASKHWEKYTKLYAKMKKKIKMSVQMGNDLMVWDEGTKTHVNVAYMDSGVKVVRPRHGYYDPHPYAKLAQAWAKKKKMRWTEGF